MEVQPYMKEVFTGNEKDMCKYKRLFNAKNKILFYGIYDLCKYKIYYKIAQRIREGKFNCVTARFLHFMWSDI